MPPSGQPGSNRRPQPWQGCALPTELCPHEHQRCNFPARCLVDISGNAWRSQTDPPPHGGTAQHACWRPGYAYRTRRTAHPPTRRRRGRCPAFPGRLVGPGRGRRRSRGVRVERPVPPRCGPSRAGAPWSRPAAPPATQGQEKTHRHQLEGAPAEDVVHRRDEHPGDALSRDELRRILADRSVTGRRSRFRECRRGSPRHRRGRG